MEYEYKGKGSVLVSSNGELKHVKENEVVDFSDDDLKKQILKNFVLAEEKKTIKKKNNKESDE